MTHYAIIVAGGTGSRMKSDVPKQFLLLKGRPVLMHTIEAFHYSDLRPEIILVLNAAFISHWNDLCLEHHFNIPYKIVNNGEQRFHSVRNALDLVADDSLVAVHDAVRPIVDNELITRSYRLAEQCGAIIPVVTSKDSVRRKTGDSSVSMNREEILLVQTPQVFQSKLLKRAYLQEYNSNFTDDASVVERLGAEVQTIEGSYQNIKITYPEDLLVAEIYLNSISNS
jgi:2-C-methyl-D-erythritol 4-phosphate cytidylyltransferase